MQQQLLYLQLKRGQAPLSWLTVFSKLDIADPQGEIDKSFKEEVELEKRKILAKIELMRELKEMGIDPSILDGGQDQGKGKPHPGGRPSSGGAAPRLKQKGAQGGTPRTVVTESK